MKLWQQLTTKVASSFLLLSLVAVGIVGGVAYFRAREALKRAAFTQLRVSATLKEEEINRWFEDQQRDFLIVTEFPDVNQQLQTFLKADASESQAAYPALSQYFRKITQLKPNLREIFLLNRSNRIVLSTNQSREGNYEILANITYLEQVESKETFAPIFYVSPDTGKPSVTLATPLYDEAGTRQGMILADLNLERIDRIVREGTGLGESGATYLVGSLVTKNTFISRDQLASQEFPDGISSQGIDAAMSGVSGSGLYTNYAGVPVIGVYRWLNDQDLALLVEMVQQEAFAPARQLAGTIVVVGLTASGVLLAGVYWLSQQLSISRRQLEQYSHQLEHQAQEAEAANRAKSKFLAHMSHELRTPLNAILGFAQLMERDSTTSARQRQSLATINRSGEHLLNLINDVLEMSKIEAQQIDLAPHSFDLYNLLQILQSMFQIRAEAKHLFLKFDIAPEVPRYILTDEGKLRQILINLLGNAVKFTAAGGVTLRVTADRSERESSHDPCSISLFFEIEDTGIGIASEDVENLFKPFVQAANSVQSEGGTGLGLAISREFVRLMEGEIGLKSYLGQGSSFFFRVPVILAQPLGVGSSSKREGIFHLAPHHTTYRLLVVDDQQENRDLLAQLLRDVGFQTRTASNGEEAIALWQEWQPHLIWMDMRMPVMDGYEATRAIKAQSQGQATVIALTASAFEEQQTKILAAGCDDLVCKPFQTQTILDKIAQHLGIEYCEKPLIPSTPPILVPQDLRVMPIEWQAALRQAAIQVDAAQIHQLLAQVPEVHHSLTQGLTALLQRYDFDEILELCQE